MPQLRDFVGVTAHSPRHHYLPWLDMGLGLFPFCSFSPSSWDSQCWTFTYLVEKVKTRSCPDFRSRVVYSLHRRCGVMLGGRVVVCWASCWHFPPTSTSCIIPFFASILQGWQHWRQCLAAVIIVWGRHTCARFELFYLGLGLAQELGPRSWVR